MKTAVASTSIDTYHDLKRDGTLSRQQAEVLACMASGRDYTLQELVRLSGLPVNVISGRVNELKHAKVLEPSPDKRPCSLTGRMVQPVRLPAQQSELFDA